MRLNFHSCLPVRMSKPRIQPGQVPEARRIVAVDVRAADDDDVADDDRRAAGGDLAERRIDADGAVGAGLRLGIPGFARLGLARRPGVADLEGLGIVHRQRHQRQSEPLHQIDDALLADGRIRCPRLRVEDGHVIAGGDDNHALVAAPVGPVGEAAARELPRRFLVADAFIELPRPQRLAALGIDRVGVAPRRRDREQPAVGIERRRPVVLVLAVDRRVPAPLHLQRVEVRRVDLIERRVARAPGVSAPVAPLARRVAADERRRLTGRPHREGAAREREEEAAEHDAACG